MIDDIHLPFGAIVNAFVKPNVEMTLQCGYKRHDNILVPVSIRDENEWIVT